MFVSIFLLWHGVSQAQAETEIFKQAFTCKTELCVSSSDPIIKQSCETKQAACKALISSKQIDPQFEKYLIRCPQPQSCTFRDSESLLKGCSTLGEEHWRQIERNLKTWKQQLQALENKCAELAKDRRSKLYRDCLTQKLPSFRWTENFDSILASIANRAQSVATWFEKTNSHIHLEGQTQCHHLKNKPDHSYSRCQFSAFINSLLEALKQPYADSHLKVITDLITETYLIKVAQHQQSQGCLTPEGTGREFCYLLGALSIESLNLASELSDMIPQPKSLAKDLIKETLQMPAGGPRNSFEVSDLKLMRRKTGKDFSELRQKELLKGVFRSAEDIEIESLEDFNAIIHHKQTKPTMHTPWPKDEKSLQKAQELSRLHHEGQQFNFSTTKKKEQITIMNHFKKVADHYAELYRQNGYKVSVERVEGPTAQSLGAYYVVIQSHSNPKIQRMLSGLQSKLDVQEVVINVDSSFYARDRSSSGSYIRTYKQIELDAMDLQDPQKLLKNDLIFHEIHHAYYEKSREDRKNLPYYGEAVFHNEKSSLVTLGGYQGEFAADEIASYRKELALMDSKAIDAQATQSNFHYASDQQERTANIALSYRESARSVLRIIDNIENSLNKNGTLLNSIHYDVHSILDPKPSTATIPLFNAKHEKIGDFSISLVDLHEHDTLDRKALVKKYLQQMKEAATKDFLDAQAKIEFLKEP